MRIQNSYDEIGKVTDAVSALSKENQLTKKQANDLFLVLDEVITNIIKFAYDKPGQYIDINLELSPKHFKFVFKDSGRPFNMTESRPREAVQSLEAAEIGGLGLHFIQKIATSMGYHRTDEQNILTLEKKYEG